MHFIRIYFNYIILKYLKYFLEYWLENLNLIAKDDPVKCPKNCGRSYTGTHRKKVLRRHLVYECGVERKFMCNICFRRFSQKYYLSSHMGTVHRMTMY